MFQSKPRRQSIFSAAGTFIAIIAVLAFLSAANTAHAATGDITGIRIVGTTTTVADASSSCNSASSCNGWVAEIDVSGLTTGGTYNFGLGTNNNPSAAKMSCTATSLGYTTSAASTTVSRTLYGTHQLRRIYNVSYSAPYPNDETLVGGTTTLRIALSDFVYSPDTNVTCTIGAGLYNDGTHSSNATTSAAVVNNSTLSYPKVIANWSWPGGTRINASLVGDHTNNADGSFTVRAVGFQRQAMNGEPLAAMVFTATDQHSHTISTTVNNMTVDSSIPDASKITEYVGTFSASQANTLTQGDLVTVNFKAYPWVGDSNAVMDTSDGVNSQPTPLYAPISFIDDRSGTYGTAAAVVDATSGNDSTCTAVAESAFSSSSPPVACATINKAAALINTYNNTNYSRNDAVGTIYLKAGNYNWTGASNTISATASKAWSIITPFPGVSRSSVVINGQSGGKALGGTKIKLENVTLNITTSPVSVFDQITYLWFDNCVISMNGTAPIYNVQDWYMTDSTSSISPSPFSTANAAPALIRGNNVSGAAKGFIYTVIGNTNNALGSLAWTNEVAGSGAPTSTQPILAYNTFYKLNNSTTNLISLFQSMTNALGAAIIQNVFEYNSTGNQPLVWIAGDSTTNGPVNNIMLWYNTMVGGRINRAYNSKGSSSVARTLWSEIGELRDQEDVKSDTFTGDGGANAGRTGNWSVLYGVGTRGVYDNETTGTGAAGNFQQEFRGLNTFGPAFVNVQPLGSNTNGTSTIGYVNRQAFDGTNANSGGGNYNLLGSSPAISMIPAGQATLPYDLAGNPRYDDGQGAAGAYEYYIVSAPTVTAQAATSLGTSTVTLNGTITSNNNASSTIEGFNYGTTTSYGSFASTTGSFAAGSFALPLTGLMASTTYHFQAFAINAAGTGTSGDLTFSTNALSAPAISAIASSTTQTTATISWTTDQAASSTVNYGGTSSYGTASTSAALVTSHSIALSGLTAATTYHFQVGGANSVGTISTSTDQTFTTQSVPDTTPPSVTLTAPSAGAVRGTATLTASSTDNVAVTGVQFKIDGINTGSSGTTSPYTINWDSTGVADGSHTIQAVANDAAGNYATSSVSVTVDNTPPARSSASPSGTLALNTASTTISLTTNENATCHYSTSSGQLFGSMTAFNTTGGTTHSQLITGLSNGGSYIYYVKCQDSVGNTNATDFTISFNVAADMTSPTATITAPLNNATVSGTSVAVTATATDDVSVANVQFQLDGSNLQAPLTLSPYAIIWDSTSAADGTHTLAAVAEDGSGNFGTSSIVTIKVDNTPPVEGTSSPSGTLPDGTTSTLLSLQTNENASCHYSISPGTSYGSMTAFGTTGAKVHSQIISGLSDGTSYNYYVKCQDTHGNTNASDYVISFSVGVDTTPPVISSVASSPNEAGATITWTTDEPSTSQVTYGTTAAYGSASTLDSSLVTSHSVTLTGLSSNTLYHYAVLSADALGNATSSPDYTFTTSAQISGGGSSGGSGGGGYVSSPVPAATLPVTTPVAGCSPGFLFNIYTGTPCTVSLTPLPTIAPNMPTFHAPPFTRNLTLGSVGIDVQNLQKYLNTHSFIVSRSGNGSPGHETTYFGPATQAALSHFQKVNHITPAVGYFGPITRRVVNGN